MARRARSGLRVKLTREWAHIPIGSTAVLGEKYRSDSGLLRIDIRFDDCPDLPFTMSRPAVEEVLMTIDDQAVVL
jgi:hypothetical protein